MILQAHPLPAFHDNYIWCLQQNGQALVVDPGDAVVVEEWLQQYGLKLAFILITHHHPDHTGGLITLKSRHQPVVYGPDEHISGVEHILTGGEQIDLGLFGQARVIFTPGHTLGHIAYHLSDSDLLFCGDTLFSAGCGRLFEGTAAQLHQSLQTLSALPDNTLVCCTHEYTEANLRFAAAAEPGNSAREYRHAEVAARRQQNQPSLPVPLSREREYNPFLRCTEPAILAELTRKTGNAIAPGLPAFTALRAWKDGF